MNITQKYLFRLAIVVVSSCSIAFCSCTPTPTPSDIDTPTAPKYGITLIRFTKPEYKNYIWIEHIDKEDTVASLCSTKHSHFGWEICPDYKDPGNSPYIELPDDYLMVDWNWNYIVWDNYPGNILFVPWDSLTDPRYQQFDISVGYDNNPIKDECFLAYHVLDEYRGAEVESCAYYCILQTQRYGLETAPCKDSGYPFDEVDIAYMNYYIARHDSNQEIYKNCIIEIINSGQLEKYQLLSTKPQESCNTDDGLLY